MKHELNLFENAIDSLNEALRQYSQASYKKPRTYKFSILLFAQSIELLFKYYVYKKNPLLIYKIPSNKNLKSKNESTINVHDAIHILINSGEEVDHQLLKHISFIREIRNDIEHYKFSLEISQIRIVIGKVLILIDKIHKKFLNQDIKNEIDREFQNLYIELLADHHEKIVHSQRRVHELENITNITSCPFCHNTDTAYFIGDQFKCLFCEKTSFLTSCSFCGIRDLDSFLYEITSYEEKLYGLNSGGILCYSCYLNLDGGNYV